MSTPEMALEIMGSLARVRQGRHLLVINTHADYDHAWGNSVFAELDSRYPAPIIGHAKTRARLLGQEARDGLAKKQAESSRFASVRLAPPDVTFTDGLEVDGGDLSLRLIPTPGHTPDHVAVWVPEIRLVLAGDAAEHPFPHVDSPHNLPTLRKSLHTLIDLQPASVLPCHGGTTDPDLPARNLAYFDEVAHHCHAALDAHTLPDDWPTSEALGNLVGFGYDDALRFAGADPATTPDFYRHFHQSAVRVTLESLTAM
jgi:glyoxylase-like metal-dependent hydrolase (beta-lactamase superfamily II)